RQIWSKASALVVNGEGLRLRAERTLPGKTIEVVPNGVDVELFRPKAGFPAPARERVPADDSRVRLLFVGRLHRQKGLSHLLQAVSRLNPDLMEQVELEFVGSGPDEQNLRSLARDLGLAERVRFSGWVSRSDIVGHYQDADIFAFPSFEEGMPNVVLEA